MAALVARTQTVLRHRGRVGQRNTGARRGREETIWIFSDSEFAHVWRQGGQGKILDAADREGATGIAKAMEAAMQNCDIETGEQLE